VAGGPKKGGKDDFEDDPIAKSLAERVAAGGISSVVPGGSKPNATPKPTTSKVPSATTKKPPQEEKKLGTAKPSTIKPAQAKPVDASKEEKKTAPISASSKIGGGSKGVDMSKFSEKKVMTNKKTVAPIQVEVPVESVIQETDHKEEET
jgi:hypothetical protein